MNHTIPHVLKAEINRIAAIKIENRNLQLLRDRILIGYAYFLTPKQYIYLYKSKPTDQHFQLNMSKGTFHAIFHLPVHPLISQILEEYGGSLPAISSFDVFPLYKQLFPKVKQTASRYFSVHMKNFDPPKKAMAAQTVEGLSWSQWAILRGYENAPPHVLEQLFNQPFFDYLRNRVSNS
jgi:hypothetical protein